MSKQPRRKEQPTEIQLIPEPQFEEALKAVLATSKEKSDEQMARIQASNRARREKRRHKD